MFSAPVPVAGTAAPAAASSMGDLEKFRFEFRDLYDVLSKTFHKDKPADD